MCRSHPFSSCPTQKRSFAVSPGWRSVRALCVCAWHSSLGLEASQSAPALCPAPPCQHPRLAATRRTQQRPDARVSTAAVIIGQPSYPESSRIGKWYRRPCRVELESPTGSLCLEGTVPHPTHTTVPDELRTALTGVLRVLLLILTADVLVPARMIPRVSAFCS